MFSTSLLKKIKTSAISYASLSNARNKETIPLTDQLNRLCGYRYSDEQLEKGDILNETISDVAEHIRCEKDKAKRNSSLYNSTRHICLYHLYDRLQKKRRKSISAL